MARRKKGKPTGPQRQRQVLVAHLALKHRYWVNEALRPTHRDLILVHDRLHAEGAKH